MIKKAAFTNPSQLSAVSGFTKVRAEKSSPTNHNYLINFVSLSGNYPLGMNKTFWWIEINLEITTHHPYKIILFFH